MTKFLFGYLLFFRLFLSRNFKHCSSLYCSFLHMNAFFRLLLSYLAIWSILPSLFFLSPSFSPHISLSLILTQFLTLSYTPTHSLSHSISITATIFVSPSLLPSLLPSPTLFNSLLFSLITHTPSQQYCHSYIPHLHATLSSSIKINYNGTHELITKQF